MHSCKIMMLHHIKRVCSFNNGYVKNGKITIESTGGQKTSTFSGSDFLFFALLFCIGSGWVVWFILLVCLLHITQFLAPWTWYCSTCVWTHVILKQGQGHLRRYMSQRVILCPHWLTLVQIRSAGLEIHFVMNISQWRVTIGLVLHIF